MAKKIIWIVIVIVITLVVVYSKWLYPGSQLQLKQTFKYVHSTPIEHFYNATEKSCGIWYESISNDSTYAGKKNNDVKDCFHKAFNRCDKKNVLIVKDEGETSEAKITYSLIRILMQNDQDDCIIQAYHEEHNLTDIDKKLPISYVNTCTVLQNDLIHSCEPLFVKETRKINNAMLMEESNGITQEDITNKTSDE
jgi:hypothetical protein